MTFLRFAVAAALAIVAIETVWLLWRWKRTGLDPRPRQAVAMTGAGAGLLVALHLAVTEASPLAVLCALSVGGALHALDLAYRLRK